MIVRDNFIFSSVDNVRGTSACDETKEYNSGLSVSNTLEYGKMIHETSRTICSNTLTKCP